MRASDAARRSSDGLASVTVRRFENSDSAIWLSYGDEAPLDPELGIAAIAVEHPPAPQSWLGLPMPWWVYWLIVSTVFALLLRRPMGVVL